MSKGCDRALELLAALEATLRDERTAVEQLDRGALTEATERKRGLLADLQGLVPLVPDGAPPALRARIKEGAARIRAQAAANAALLTDAVAIVNETLGIRSDLGLYDRHARRVDEVRALAGSQA